MSSLLSSYRIIFYVFVFFTHSVNLNLLLVFNFEVEMAEAETNITPVGDSHNNCNESDKQTGLCNLNSFVVKRVLKSDAQRKTIFVEGLFTDREGKAVLLLEKQPFDEQSLSLVTSHSNIEKQFVNDVYGNYDCYTDPIYNRKCIHLC